MGHSGFRSPDEHTIARIEKTVGVVGRYELYSGWFQRATLLFEVLLHVKLTSFVAAVAVATLTTAAFSAGEIIVESFADGVNGTGFKKMSGGWLESSSKSQAPGLKASKAMFNTVDTQPGTARFTPEIPENGKYDVYITYPKSGNAKGVIYKITSADGSKDVVSDQNGRVSGADVWTLIGTFQFNKGNSGYVEISDPGTGQRAFEKEPNARVYADAIMLLPAGSPPPAGSAKGGSKPAAAPQTASAPTAPSVASVGTAPAPGSASALPSLTGPGATASLPQLGSAGAGVSIPAPGAPMASSALPPLGTAPSAGTGSGLPSLSAPPAAGTAALPPQGVAPGSGLPSLAAPPAGTGLPALGAAPAAGTTGLPPLSTAPVAGAGLPPLGTAPSSLPSLAAPSAGTGLPPLGAAPGAGLPPLGTQSSASVAVNSALPPAQATLPGAGETSGPAGGIASLIKEGDTLPWAYDLGAAVTTAKTSGQRVLVFFVARGNLREQKYEEYFTNPAVRASLGKFLLVKIDFPTNTRTAYQQHVFGAGTIATLDQYGNWVSSITELPPSAEDLAKQLEAVPAIK